MAGPTRRRSHAEESAIEAVAAQLNQRGWSATPTVDPTIAGVDLYAFWPHAARRLAIRVKGAPRLVRSGEPEWLIGVWRFQSRARREQGLPFFRHPYYPGYWVLWDFAIQCNLHVFVWPQRAEESEPRFFVVPTRELRRGLMSGPPPWLDNYHGVRDRPQWISLEVVRPFEGQWAGLEDMDFEDPD